MPIRISTLLCGVCVFGLLGCQGNSVVQKDIPAIQTASAGGESEDLAMKFSLAQLYEQDDQLVSAKKSYWELLQADAENADYNHRYGIVQCKLGEHEKGIEYLRVADSARPNDVDILNDLGFACMVTGKNELAIGVLETALESDPRNERATNNLALAHGYSGDFDEAFSIFQQIMGEAEAMSNLGYIATQSGKKDFAIECYSRALDLDPDMDSAKEALVQLADLEQRIAHRKSIAAETESGQGGVINASATINASASGADAKGQVKHADGVRQARSAN